MSNENKPNENRQENQQPLTPAKPVELSDEDLKQVVGGFEPNSPVGFITPDGVIIDY